MASQQQCLITDHHLRLQGPSMHVPSCCSWKLSSLTSLRGFAHMLSRQKALASWTLATPRRWVATAESITRTAVSGCHLCFGLYSSPHLQPFQESRIHPSCSCCAGHMERIRRGCTGCTEMTSMTGISRHHGITAVSRGMLQHLDK